jgi:hypothetical protein
MLDRLELVSYYALNNKFSLKGDNNGSNFALALG